MRKSINGFIYTVYTALMCALCFSTALCITAHASSLGEIMADTCRKNTSADAAVITVYDEQAAQSAQNGEMSIVTVKNVTGKEIYEKTGKIISQGGEVYLSGMEVIFTKSIGGSTDVHIDSINIGGSAAEEGQLYTLALAETGAAEYDGEIVGTYSVDMSALKNYVAGFEQKNETQQENGGKGDDAEKSGDVQQKSEGREILERQTPRFVWSLVLLAGILAVYIVIRRKRKKKEEQ